MFPLTSIIESRANNSAYVSFYNIGENSPRDRAMAMLIKTYIGQPYYMELRTNQQLGYIVTAGAYSTDNYSGMYCIIQSDSYSPDEVQRRSLEFLSGAVNNLDVLPEEQFNVYKSAVREKINEKTTSISKESARRHNLAYKFNNNYERDQETLLELDGITIKEMKETLVETLDLDSKRNVTVLLYAKDLQVPGNIKSSFQDLNNWKQTQLYK